LVVVVLEAADVFDAEAGPLVEDLADVPFAVGESVLSRRTATLTPAAVVTAAFFAGGGVTVEPGVEAIVDLGVNEGMDSCFRFFPRTSII
jgi:hypothetical protein